MLVVFYWPDTPGAGDAAYLHWPPTPGLVVMLVDIFTGLRPT